MTREVKQKKLSRDLKSEAASLVKAVNVKGDSRAETQRIVAGVQRALEYHLRQHSAKARALDKKAKKLKQHESALEDAQDSNEPESENARSYSGSKGWLPWLLLAVSWSVFAGYLVWSTP